MSADVGHQQTIGLCSQRLGSMEEVRAIQPKLSEGPVASKGIRV